MLCSNRPAVNEPLCALFDRETSNGRDMARYSDLLAKAVASIGRTFRKRAAGQLQAGRGGLLPTRAEQPGGGDDFELITWLVIR